MGQSTEGHSGMWLPLFLAVSLRNALTASLLGWDREHLWSLIPTCRSRSEAAMQMLAGLDRAALPTLCNTPTVLTHYQITPGHSNFTPLTNQRCYLARCKFLPPFLLAGISSPKWYETSVLQFCFSFRDCILGLEHVIDLINISANCPGFWWV